MKYSYRRGRPGAVLYRCFRALGRRMRRLPGAGGGARRIAGNIPISRGGLEVPRMWKIIDSLSFKKIFILWIALIMAFGLLFYLTHRVSPGNGLTGSGPGSGSLMNAIYFSFITATSTGFGDITPVGLSRVISIIEVISTLVIFSVVISKLVSFKQNIILDEIYEVSIDEKVSGLRSALYLSRSDIGRITDRLIVDGRISRVSAESLWTIINVMHENMMEIRKVICPPYNRKSEFIKRVDNFQVELIINGMTISVRKVNDLLIQLNSVPYNWRSGKNLESIGAILSTLDSIIAYHALGSPSGTITKRIGEMRAAMEELRKTLHAPGKIACRT